MKVFPQTEGPHTEGIQTGGPQNNYHTLLKEYDTCLLSEAAFGLKLVFSLVYIYGIFTN